jgi:prepilin peptidase CpaA
MVDVAALVILTGVLVGAAVADVRRGIVPNALTYPAILAGLLLWTLAGLVTQGLDGGGDGAGRSVIGLAAAFVPYAIVFSAGGLGGGDVKLMTAGGAIAGSWQWVLSASLYSFLAAAVIALFLMIRHRIVKRTLSRIFGAALVAAARSKPVIPDDSPRVPFALAAAVGGILAGVEHLGHVPMLWNG